MGSIGSMGIMGSVGNNTQSLLAKQKIGMTRLATTQLKLLRLTPILAAPLMGCTKLA